MTETDSSGMNPSSVTPVVLMPLPDHDFDPTEAAIPWEVCTSRGFRVAFSTEHGNIAQADAYKLNGPLPGLLSAGAKAQAAYRQMTHDSFFQHPIPYAEIDPSRYEAILLPGGDAPGVRQYLESSTLHNKVHQFFQLDRLVGAICHGVLVPARAIDPQTGRSVLYGRKVTATPKLLDLLAYRLDSWLIKHGYIMYSSCVADEVRACLENPGDFFTGPSVLVPYVLTDGNLITSRWYMDAQQFGNRFADVLQERMHAGSAV